ncbi:MAG: hypothetical protein K1X89_17315 [Myxococcaceae bacterium]|nr:hypothetical protein [Myxococcaceae bacterium]
MGLAVLAVSWATALMVMLDLLIDFRALGARAKALRGRVLQATVGEKTLGFHEVEQRVRQFEVPKPAFALFDRAHRWSLTGGPVTAGTEPLEVVPAPGAEVWPELGAQQAQPVDPSLLKASAGPKGALRVVRTELSPGTTVFLAGTREGATLRTELASLVEPLSWLRSRRTLVLGLIALDLAWASAGTAVALWPPVFGLVSKLGAAVLLGHFLGITPLAVLVREKCRWPSLAFVQGEKPLPAAPPQPQA